MGNLAQRVLRVLFRHGGTIAEGVLGLYAQSKIGDEAFQEALRGLAESGLVSFKPTGYGRARLVCLTGAGKAEAERMRDEALAAATQKD